MQRTALFLSLFLTIPLSALESGRSAPAFELSSLTQEKVSLAQYIGKVVFVHFWASWCAPCIVEFPRLNQFAASQDPKQVVVLAISVDQTRENIDRFLKKRVKDPLKLQILHDLRGTVAEAYQNEAMPMTYVLDRKGVVRFAHMGFHAGDEKKWLNDIQPLLNEPAP